MSEKWFGATALLAVTAFGLTLARLQHQKTFEVSRQCNLQ